MSVAVLGRQPEALRGLSQKIEFDENRGLVALTQPSWPGSITTAAGAMNSCTQPSGNCM